MSRARTRSAIAALSLLFTCAAAPTGSYRIPGKLSFDPPTNWVEVSPADFLAAIKKNLNVLPTSVQATASKMDEPLAVFLGADSGMFRSNLNIRQIKGTPTVDEKGLAEYRQHALKAFGPAIRATVDSAEIVALGERRGLRAELTYTLNNQQLKSVQGVLPARSHTYIATFTTLASTFAAEKAAIEASLLSLRTDEAWHTPLTSRPILLYGLIGAIGGFILVFIFKRRKD